jgi:hypothetical protein
MGADIEVLFTSLSFRNPITAGCSLWCDRVVAAVIMPLGKELLLVGGPTEDLVVVVVVMILVPAATTLFF